MKKNQSFETIFVSQKILSTQLINIKGGRSIIADISCDSGKVKCKDGDDKKEKLSVW